jgi:hypothetical protein
MLNVPYHYESLHTHVVIQFIQTRPDKIIFTITYIHKIFYQAAAK